LLPTQLLPLVYVPRDFQKWQLHVWKDCWLWLGKVCGLLILSFEEIFRVSCLISIFAEFLCGEIRSLDGEEGVLIQAIMSIISIIKLEPAIYEKVFFWFFLIKLFPMALFFCVDLNVWNDNIEMCNKVGMGLVFTNILCLI
jgi:hypothetical protein